jgi:hypothetical protein
MLVTGKIFRPRLGVEQGVLDNANYSTIGSQQRKSTERNWNDERRI